MEARGKPRPLLRRLSEQRDAAPDAVHGLDDHPSIWWENSPVVIQESFFHGRPMICSNIGGMAEKITDGVDGLHFRVAASEDLVDRMIEVLRPDLWDRLRAASSGPSATGNAPGATPKSSTTFAGASGQGTTTPGMPVRAPKCSTAPSLMTLKSVPFNVGALNDHRNLWSFLWLKSSSSSRRAKSTITIMSAGTDTRRSRGHQPLPQHR